MKKIKLKILQEVIKLDSAKFIDENLDEIPSFNGVLKGSEAFNELMDYSLLLVDSEFLDLKKYLLINLVKRSHTTDDLFRIGKKAIRTCLYDLEKEGFLTRKTKDDSLIFEFNRSKILFKIKKDLENNHKKLKEMEKIFSKGPIFRCNVCGTFFNYTEAMEKDFQCCAQKLKSFEKTKILRKISQKLVFIEDKLDLLNEILQ